MNAGTPLPAGSMAKLFFLSMLCCLSAAAQTVVEGNVVNSVTGTGVSGVKVNLVTSGEVAYTTTTDAQGHFLFDHVQSGDYIANYSSPDYFFEPGTPPRLQRFQASDGTPVKLEAQMTPLARLSGRVVDGSGKPVPDALISVSGPNSSMTVHTDEKGAFEIHQMLMPGLYTLAAAPPPDLKPPKAEAEGVLNWTRTFYPGVTTPEAAEKISLLPGGVVSDLELKLLAVPAHAVRGVLLYPDGTPVAKIPIVLGPEPATLRTASSDDGSFEFPAVVDGEWDLVAEVAGSGAGGVRLRASTWFEMVGGAIEGLKLRLAAPFTLRGKVTMETPEGSAVARPPGGLVLGVHMSRALREVFRDNGILTAAGPGSFNARPEGDGNFSIANVYPGSYRILPPNPPAGYYLDSVRLGETETSTPEVEISSGAVPINVAYKTNGGAVRGAAENCASGGVVLIPQDSAMRRPGFLRSHACDANSHYALEAVRPGDYYVVALSGGGAKPWYGARIDDALLNLGSLVTVRASEVSSLDLRAVAPPD